MNKEQQRKEFEEWALDKVTSLKIDEIDNEYFWVETHLAWEAWQAAQKGLTAQRDQWKDKYIQQNKDLGYELRDPNGTIWSECKRLQAELTTATEQRDRLTEAIRLTLMDNLDLCDGDICTLKRLKDAIGFELDSQEI
jgi:hypothetical protein